MAKKLVPQTRADLSIGKKLTMNGEKLAGVREFQVVYNIDKVVTEVVIKMVIKRDSLKITDSEISFNTADK